MIAPHDLRGAALLLVAFALLIATAELWARRGRPDPEWPRKLVHLGGGLGCLAFPWLIVSWEVVLVLALGFSAVFALGRGHLRCLGGVARASRGSEYYPFAVFLLFLIARHERWLYVATLLVLAIADTCAALVGQRWGRHRYRVDAANEKSLEGSLAFAAAAYLVLAVPMLLLGGFPPAVALLAALLVALVLTLVEAVSSRGADNLFVPVAAAYVLLKITYKPVGEIAFQCASLVVLIALTALAAWRWRCFDAAAAAIFIGVAYGAWSLGSPAWGLPLLGAAGAYALLRGLIAGRTGEERVGASTAFTTLAIPLLLVVSANSALQYQTFYAPYLATVAATASMAAWLLLHQRWPWGWFWAPPVLGLGAWLATLAPLLLWARRIPLVQALHLGGVVIAVSVLHAVALQAFHRRDRRPGSDGAVPSYWPVVQVGLANVALLAATLHALLLHPAVWPGVEG
jgi:phytol kinase